MRAVLTADDARVEVLAGRAEQIPAASSSVDVVIAQSAWHWVDEARAIPEVARVLRPGGRLSLVWTGPDRSVDWMRSLWAGGIIFSPEEQSDEDGRRRRRHLVNVDVGGDSPFLEPETKLFQWTRPMAKADLVALSATYSAVITMEENARREHLERMSALSRRARGVRRARHHRRPDALLLLAGHQALSPGASTPLPRPVTGGTSPVPPSSRRLWAVADGCCESSSVRRTTPRTRPRRSAAAHRSGAHRVQYRLERAGAPHTTKGHTPMQIRLRNVLAVGALTSGLLAGGALVANAATTSTTDRQHRARARPRPPNSSTTTPSSSSSSTGTLGVELRRRVRLDQELPEHGQRLGLRRPARPRPDPALRRRPARAAGRPRAPRRPAPHPDPTTEERAVWAGSPPRSAPPPLGSPR